MSSASEDKSRVDGGEIPGTGGTIRFYDTLSKRLAPFVPMEEGRVRLYTCGPTVYDFAHIGNFRTYVWEDLLRRFLEWRGFQVDHVMNLTDVDDKTIRGANEKGISLDEYTAPFREAFFQDIETLRILPAKWYPRATEHIPEMVALVKSLEEKGHTYRSEGSIYFSITSFPAYGRLSGFSLEAVQPGARVDSDEYEKEDVRDFVLWKAPKEGEPSWDTEVGPGRPGWHIECSAMSMKYLGETFDIHTGGVDNIFPHHENEIAQSEGATGKPFVRYWLHAAHLIAEGEKMSKSLGNFYTLRELLDRGADPRAIRYLLLSTHYRKSLNFTFEGLTQAGAALRRMDDLVLRLKEARGEDGESPDWEARLVQAREGFGDALADDLNISGALGAVYDLVRDANRALQERTMLEGDRLATLRLLDSLDDVLAVFDVEKRVPPVIHLELATGEGLRVLSQVELSEETLRQIKEREEARRRRDFETADRLRDELAGEHDLALEDTLEGLRVRLRSY
jgi:cysteinyl-tRNA synthetase